MTHHSPIQYGRVCVATGGVPRVIEENNPFVITVRDNESIVQFRQRLGASRRVLLVGNGGIATEIAYEIEDCQVVWVVKHDTISVPFLDAAAAQFLLQSRNKKKVSGDTCYTEKASGKIAPLIQTLRYSLSSREDSSGDQRSGSLVPVIMSEHGDTNAFRIYGSALGPDWAQGHKFVGTLNNGRFHRPLKVVYKCQVAKVLSPEEYASLEISEILEDAEGSLLDLPISDWPVYVRLTNGEVYGCDFVISATGVDANLGPETVKQQGVVGTFATENPGLKTADVSKGGGIVVSEFMQSSIPEVYAVGDCAYAGWTPSPHWFQMKLWSQARQMAFQAAKSMFFHSRTELEDVPQDFSFELFSHVTHFFGFKVVLLGLFNGQGIDLTAADCRILLRITPGEEYVKCVMKNGRMQGAILIGETELEETFENLILNQLDLSAHGDHLLDPNIDLSDYFD